MQNAGRVKRWLVGWLRPEGRRTRRHVVVIHADGGIEHVHSDALRAPGLGEREAVRLSDVEMEDGVWVARKADTGEEIARHEDRSECIRQEVEYFQEMLRQGRRLA
jgi:hypothetical protein